MDSFEPIIKRDEKTSGGDDSGIDYETSGGLNGSPLALSGALDDLKVAPKPPKRKLIEEDEEDKKPKRLLILDPLTWHTAMCLGNELQTVEEGILTKEMRACIELLLKKFEETGCSPEVKYSKERDYDGLQAILENSLLISFRPTKAIKKLKPPTASEKAPMLLLTFTNPEYLKEGVKGAEILKEAKRWVEEKRNAVYDTKSLKMIKLIDGWKPNSTFLRDKGFKEAQKGEKGKLLPLVVIHVAPGFNEKELEAQVTSLSTVVLRGLGEACGMDYGAFGIEEITRLDPGQQITILRHRPQSSTTNYRMTGREQARQWNVDTVEEKSRNLEQFTKNYKEIQEVGKRGFQKLVSDWSNREAIIEKLTRDLKSAQFPLLKGRNVDGTFPISSFASNVDLDPEIFTYQHEQIAKLPTFCQPKRGLMEYCDTSLPGINEVQMYLKSPGGRTPGHVENQVMASINLNIGPGDCTWICIPMMHIAKIEKYLRDNSIFPYASTFWINEEDLKANGIPYQKFVQKKGDLVYVGIGTYHWVQSNGYCANVSWNVAQMDAVQLMASAIIHDHNAEQRYTSIVPLVPMMWNMVMEGESKGTELARIVKKLLVSSLAKCQIELDTATVKKIPVVPMADSIYSIPQVALCSRMTCPRPTLFNLVAVNKNDEAAPITCIDCAHVNSDVTAYQRYSMNDLVEWFDAYH